MAVIPRLDITDMRFPTDRLTVADMRREWPCSFNVVGLTDRGAMGCGRASIEDTLGGVIDLERLIANIEFKRILDLPLTDAEGKKSMIDLVQDLSDIYYDIELSSGQYSAEMLVNGIIKQAASQAERFQNRLG